MTAAETIDQRTATRADAAPCSVMSTTVRARVVVIGICAVVLIAPFEALRPLIAWPGQSLTIVECVLAAVLAASGVAIVASQPAPALLLRGLLPWGSVAGVALISALCAPLYRANAVHMSLRLGVLAVLCALVPIAKPAAGRDMTRILRTIVMSGALVAALVLLDFARVPIVESFFQQFRSGVAVVGAQIRASGPLQYPTIASMYLEVVFAVGVGLLLDDEPLGMRLVLLAVLSLVAEAIVLTFTRAGLITMGLTLAGVAVVRQSAGTPGRTLAWIALLTLIVGSELLVSRSAESWRLRLTSEGQGRWFSAAIDAPRSIAADTMRPIAVPLVITNTGRATWDSSSNEPVRLSYHWVASDSDEVVAWEGRRTNFPEPVPPGATVSLDATVSGPGRPGRFRLMWDMEQEKRLWFSTEPDATPVFTDVLVTGAAATLPHRTSGPARIPIAQERPGRLMLWRAAWRMALAHPLLGVGPDNYRLLYGEYGAFKRADPRVHSNNMYLEVLAGSGILGLTTFLWAGLHTVRESIAAARTSAAGAGVAAAVTAVAVHGLVDSFLSFTSTYLLIAVIAGLAASMGHGANAHAHRV
ncbi:MAG: O-antigen ligase family protein [Vicinamibacterales bacterium]